MVGVLTPLFLFCVLLCSFLVKNYFNESDIYLFVVKVSNIDFSAFFLMVGSFLAFSSTQEKTFIEKVFFCECILFASIALLSKMTIDMSSFANSTNEYRILINEHVITQELSVQAGNRAKPWLSLFFSSVLSVVAVFLCYSVNLLFKEKAR